MSITWLGLALVIGGSLLAGAALGGYLAFLYMQRVVSKELDWDKQFLVALRELYRDPDHDINGGDLVEAVGLWAHGKKWMALAHIQVMLPSFKEGRS